MRTRHPRRPLLHGRRLPAPAPEASTASRPRFVGRRAAGDRAGRNRAVVLSWPVLSRSLRRRVAGDDDAGYVTAEAALVLPVLVLVCGAMLAVVAAMSDRVACVDAARIGARALARGESPAAVAEAVRAAAPAHAVMTTRCDGPLVEVVVSASVPGGELIARHLLTVRATSVAADEPATDPVIDDPAGGAAPVAGDAPPACATAGPVT